MIELTPQEVKWIKLCKNHYNKDIPKGQKETKLKRLAWMYELVYGWSPTEHYNDFLNCMFNKLLDIWIKIEYDQSGNNNQLRAVFYSAFNKGWDTDPELPIERAINALYSEIAFTTVVENGSIRFNLYEDESRRK